MESSIKQIMLEELDKFDKIKKTAEFEKYKDECDKIEEQLSKTFTKKQLQLFNDFCVSYSMTLLAENEAYYTQGFKKGVQLLFEALADRFE